MPSHTTRCYHGTPHDIDSEVLKSMCSEGLKYSPALTNNFAMAAWHALKNRKTGIVLVCAVDVHDAEYVFSRGGNDNKAVYKFKHVPAERIAETVVVRRDQNGMAKIVRRV